MTVPQRVPLGRLLRRAPRYGINAAAVPLKPGVPTYIRITDINEYGSFAPDPKVGVSHLSADSYVLRPGELVFARTGASVGKSYLYDPADGRLVYAGFLINIAPDPKQLDPRFLALFVQTKEYWDWIARTSVRSGQPGVNGREYATLLVPLPDIATQNAVAEAVGDVDRFIRSLERKIAKKQAIKQGMMQQLLTGRTRLPGFVHPWQKRRVTEIVAGLEAGVSVRSVATSSGGPSILKTSAVEQGRFIPGEAKPILEADLSRVRCSPIAGSMIISRMNTPALVGEVGYVAESRPDLFLPDRLWLVRSKTSAQADMRWLTYFFASEPGAQLLRGLATGTSGSMKNIPKDRVLGLEIPTPDPTEQEAISAVLADADCEIGRLNARLAKTRDIKTGMTQQLLTGRVRPPVEVAS